MNLSLILFLFGILEYVLNKKNIILMLISIEIMLLAVIFLIKRIVLALVLGKSEVGLRSSLSFLSFEVPKAHPKVSLPLESGFLSQYIQTFLSKFASRKVFCFTILATLVILLGYRIPAKFMLGELGMLAYFPFFNVVFTLCTIAIVAHLNEKEVSRVRLAFAAILPFLVAFVG